MKKWKDGRGNEARERERRDNDSESCEGEEGSDARRETADAVLMLCRGRRNALFFSP